jgi:NFU1 iron-sulfur cluster scaffold homolog, mitochondrial
VAFVVRDIQPTPNPNAMKFVLDRTIAATPARFYTKEEAINHPLASRLLAVAGVSHVMLLADFVTIGKEPAARWSDIKPRVSRLLSDA